MYSFSYFKEKGRQAILDLIAQRIGFEIKAEKIDNVFKMSQNRNEKSYLNIILKLEALGGSSALTASEMKIRKAALFPVGIPRDSSKFDS